MNTIMKANTIINIFILFLTTCFLFISCSSDIKESELKSSKKRFISIARYKPGEQACCKGIFLDPTGFNYHYCLFSEDSLDLNKKKAITDKIAFKFINELDTLSLLKLESCIEYQGKWTGYFYEIFFDFGNISKSIMLREQSYLCESSTKLDTIQLLFTNLEKGVPFQVKK